MHIVISNTSDLPIYVQIKEQVKEQILSGELEEDEMLPLSLIHIYNPGAPSPFVTWQFTEGENGHRDYYWGRYGTSQAWAQMCIRDRP